MSETVHSADVAQVEGEAPAENDIPLSLTDIQNIVKIVDYAADQGAFRGWPVIEQVLLVRNRFNTFLEAAAANQPAAEAAAEANPDAA